MTMPRQVVAGRTYMVTRRCLEGRFFFTPDEGGKVEEAQLYCVGLAARNTGLKVHAYVFMPNHYHQVMTDPQGEMPAGLQQLNSNLARVFNDKLERKDALFEGSRSYSAVRCVTRMAVLERMAYTVTNPVAAGLVETPEEWPGAISLPKNFGKWIVAKRPEWFFRKNKKGAGKRKRAQKADAQGVDPVDPQPDEVRFKLERPPEFKDTTNAEFVRLFELAIEERMEAIRADRKARKLHGFVGRRRILGQNPRHNLEDLLKTEEEKRAHRAKELEKKGKKNPHLAEGPESEPAKNAKQELVAFRTKYREAMELFHDQGQRDTLFPFGTWGPARFYGARVADAA